MSVIGPLCGGDLINKKLSYRKQIARNLPTQYFESIYNNPATLKSRLRITQVTGNGTIG